MLMPNEVCSLFVDKQQQIWGLRLRKSKKDTYTITKTVKQEVKEGAEIVETLAQVLLGLGGSGNYPTILFQSLSGMVTIDVPLDVRRLPDAEMTLLIAEELPSFFPGNLEEFCWHWRVVCDSEADNHCVVRVTLLPQNIWNDFVEKLQAGKIKIDIFAHPFLSLEPLFSQEKVCLPACEGGLSLLPLSLKSGREIDFSECDFDVVEILKRHKMTITSLTDELPKEISNILLINALAILSSNKQARGSLILPKQMRPKRGRLLYVIAMTCLSVFCVSGLTLGARHLVDRYQVQEVIKSEIKSTSAMVDQVKRQVRSYNKICEILDSIDSKKKGNQHIIDFLYDFSRILPDTMRCVSLRFTDPNLDLVILMPLDADTTDLVNSLEASKKIKVVKRNQINNQRDGTTTLRLTLNYKYE